MDKAKDKIMEVEISVEEARYAPQKMLVLRVDGVVVGTIFLQEEHVESICDLIKEVRDVNFVKKTLSRRIRDLEKKVVELEGDNRDLEKKVVELEGDNFDIKETLDMGLS